MSFLDIAADPFLGSGSAIGPIALVLIIGLVLLGVLVVTAAIIVPVVVLTKKKKKAEVPPEEIKNE